MKTATLNPEVLPEVSTIRDEGTHQAEFRETYLSYLKTGNTRADEHGCAVTHPEVVKISGIQIAGSENPHQTLADGV
jgi:hypothetical protein